MFLLLAIPRCGRFVKFGYNYTISRLPKSTAILLRDLFRIFTLFSYVIFRGTRFVK